MPIPSPCIGRSMAWAASETEAAAAVGELVGALNKNASLRACFASEFHQFPFGAHRCDSSTQVDLLATAQSLMERYPALRKPVLEASEPR